MRSYTKRVLSMLLCLALVLTFPMPVVFAESGTKDEMDSQSLGTSTDSGTALPEESQSEEKPEEEGHEPQPATPTDSAPQTMEIGATALPLISVRVEYTDSYGTFPADYEFHPDEGGGTIALIDPSTEYDVFYCIYLTVQGYGETIGKAGTLGEITGRFDVIGGINESGGTLHLGFNVVVYGYSGPMPENPDLYYKVTGRLMELDARDDEGYPVNRPLTYDPSRFGPNERPTISVLIDGDDTYMDGLGEVRPDGTFAFYLLKSVIDPLQEGHSIFLRLDSFYASHEQQVIMPAQIIDGMTVHIFTNWAGTVRGSINRGHLPADIIYNDATAYGVVGFSAVDGSSATSFWSYLSLNRAGDNIPFYLVGVKAGEYKVYFGYAEQLWGSVSIFQYYGGTSLEDATTITMEAFEDIEGIGTVSWPGDRDHAGTGDVYGPVVMGVDPLSNNQSAEGELNITFNEAIDTATSGVVRLVGVDETVEAKILPIGTWSADNKTYMVNYAGLMEGRLYRVEISGFQDALGNAMSADSRYCLVVQAGEITRVIEHPLSGISVQGYITPDATINILEGLASAHRYGNDPACDAMHKAQDDGLLLSVHDITVNDGRFNGSLTITMPIDPQYNGMTVSIFHCKNGTLETKTATVVDGKVIFILDSLSPIAIVLPSGGNSDVIDLSDVHPPASGGGWTYANNVYTILDGADVTVMGGTGQYRIEVAAGATATIRLNNAQFFYQNPNQSSLLLNSGTNLTLELAGGNNLLNRGFNVPAIKVPLGATLTIDGNATLYTAGDSGVTDIGGATPADSGTIAINGGIISAGNGKGIVSGIGNTFTMNGNAIVVTSSVTDASPKQQGILFVAHAGTVYRDVTLAYNEIGISSNETLTVPSGASLTIAAGAVFKNAGTVIPADGSTITVCGTVDSGENLTKINGANVGIPAVNGTPTGNSIAVSTVSLLAVTGQDIEYAVSTSQITPTSGWQSGTSFPGLSANTAYYVFARSKEDANFKAGVASMSAAITTADAPDTTPPILSGGTAERTSDTRVQIRFSTNEAGSIYGIALESGAAAPSKETVQSTGVSLGAIAGTGLTGGGLDITPGAKDVYVVMQDAAGNISDPLHIPVPAYNPVLVQAITGVTSPVAGATPSTAINNGTGFTAALTWDGNPAQFAEGTVYTAHVILTAASGYTFHGVFGNTAAISGFTVNGITPVWVSNNGTILEFTVTFPATTAETYAATIDPTSKTFPAAIYGYNTQAEQQFSLKNTGSAAIYGPTASLQNGDISAFEISIPFSDAGIATGGINTVSVRPKTGLAAGTYTDTLNIAVGSSISLNVPLSFTVNKASLGGSVTITGTAKFGQTLTANTSSLSSTPNTSLGTLSYQWKRGNSNISGATSSSYQLAQADIGQTITVTVTAVNCSGEVTSGATATVAKADGPAAPSSVTGSYTSDGTTFTYTVNTIAGAEYSKDGVIWQDGNVFTGFTTASPATTFYARIKATATHNESAAGNTGAVTFAKLANSSVPTLDYTITGTSLNKTVTITAVPGAEYQFGTDGWSATNIRTYAADVTETIYIRFAATATHHESASASTVVNLANAEQTAPLPYTLEYTLNSDNATFTAIIPAVAGGEYSFDGVTFSSVNTKADCQPNTSYTGYVRLAAKTGFNASPVSSDTKTTPMLTVATPVISPASTNFTGIQSVTITCATPGAVIYYTTDGTEPTAASTPYTASFNVTAATTVRAIAIHAGMKNSAIGTATYTFAVPSSLVTVNDSYAGTTGAGSYAQGTTVTINAGSRSNYSFSGWTVNSAGVTLFNANNATTTFIMPSVEVTVTANWTYTGSNRGGGGSGGTSPSKTINDGQFPLGSGDRVKQPVVASVSLEILADKDGNAVVTVTDAMIKKAIDKAQAEAKQFNKEKDGIVIEIKLMTSNGIKSLTVKCETGAISRLNIAGAGLSVNCSIYRFTLDAAAVKELYTHSKNGLTFTAIPVTKLSDAASTIGNRPVFDFTTKDGNGKVITSYGKGTITRGIKYTAASNEQTGSLFIVKIVDGEIEWIDKSSYDNGWVIWSSDSNSVYGVGYKTPAFAFTDTVNHWAKNDIDFVASRGLFSGTSATTFSPDTFITRGMFVTALGRLSGQNMSGYTTGSFTDVAAGSYYLPYIEWATEHKIVSGIGNNQFVPDKAITREEMAAMIYNYAKVTKYTFPASRKAVVFTDSAQIRSWAKDAVKDLQQAGIVSGVGNGRFNPKGTATRAEAATILCNFVGSVVDESTARD